MKKILFFLVLLFSFSTTFAADSDYDGIDDSVDACPNTIFTETHLVSTNWCTKATTQENITNWNAQSTWDNIKTWNQNSWNWIRNNFLNSIKSDEDFSASNSWEQGIFYFMIRIAKDLKNIFFILVWLYLIVLVILIFFSANTEEQIWKFKKWIIWSTIWIIIMQTAYSFTKSLYDKWVNQWVSFSFVTDIIYPFIHMLEYLASFIFLAIAIYAFFRLVTANWREDKIKLWKNSIIQAIIWFIVIKISWWIVSNIYGQLNCSNSSIITEACLKNPNIEWTLWVVVTVINWINWFIWILIIVMIIYSWLKIILSWWNEESVKKWKAMIKYIFIWLLLLVTSYLILTFFIIPESKI